MSVGRADRRAVSPRCSLAPRGAQAQSRPADRRLGTLKVCLGRWVQMKQLRASEGARVTQRSLCLKKAGERVADKGKGLRPRRHSISLSVGPGGTCDGRDGGGLWGRGLRAWGALGGGVPVPSVGHIPGPHHELSW